MARTPTTRSPAKGKAAPPMLSLDSPTPPPKPASVRAQAPRLPQPEAPPARRPNMPPAAAASTGGGSEERLARGGRVKGKGC